MIHFEELRICGRETLRDQIPRFFVEMKVFYEGYLSPIGD